jgi:hypothetical protein
VDAVASPEIRFEVDLPAAGNGAVGRKRLIETRSPEWRPD